jgi:predicted kinase
MRTIILTKGIPASGKSTWALKEMNSHRGKYKRFNKDEMRKMIDGEYRSPDCEDFIADVRSEGVELALIQGYDIILDDTNFSNKNFYTVCEIAERIGDVRVMEKFFDIKLKDALRNNAQRPHPIPEHIIESMYEKHIKNSRVEIRDVYYPPSIRPHRVPTAELPNAVICDLDGTLALAFDRDYYDNTKIETDTVNEFVLRQLVMHIKFGDSVFFVSGRPSSANDSTRYWLESILDSVCENNDISYWLQLYLREEGDMRPDAIVKKEIYEQHIKDKFNIVAVYDDRRKVVHMWEQLGLPVFQVFDTRI